MARWTGGPLRRDAVPSSSPAVAAAAAAVAAAAVNAEVVNTPAPAVITPAPPPGETLDATASMTPLDESTLQDLVLQIKLDTPNATQKEVCAALAASGHTVPLADVKKAANKVARRLAKQQDHSALIECRL